MKLECKKAVYPTFPWWDKAAIRFGRLDMPLCVISPEDMAALHADPDKAVISFPSYISQNRSGTEVAVWPIPDADYELARI